MRIKKMNPETNFTKLPNELFTLVDSKYINTYDFIILSKLLNLPNNFKINKKYLADKLSISRTTLIKSIDKLNELNIISVTDETVLYNSIGVNRLISSVHEVNTLLIIIKTTQKSK